MKTAIVCIGDELLNGFTIDGNSSWIAKKILPYNLDVNLIINLKDSVEDIKEKIDHLIKSDYSYIFFTGGLGPTHDDVTKTAFLEYFKSDLFLYKPHYEKINNYFKNKKLKINLSHLKSQSEILSNSKPLNNSSGTALGMALKFKNIQIFILPGVPFEMKNMFEKEIIPNYISVNNSYTQNNLTLLTSGISESRLYDMLEKYISDNSDTKFSFLPSFKGVKIRLEVNKNNVKYIDTVKNDLYNKIGSYIYGYDEDSIEEVIANYLFDRNLSISIAESCTGGIISSKLTDVPGSSKFFKGSIIAYSNDIKENLLSISSDLLLQKGAVSSEVALSMARKVSEKFETDIGVSTTGISGPSGGSDSKPIGLVYVAVVFKDIEIVKKFNLYPERKIHREVTSHVALNMLRKLFL